MQRGSWAQRSTTIWPWAEQAMGPAQPLRELLAWGLSATRWFGLKQWRLSQRCDIWTPGWSLPVRATKATIWMRKGVCAWRPVRCRSRFRFVQTCLPVSAHLLGPCLAFSLSPAHSHHRWSGPPEPAACKWLFSGQRTLFRNDLAAALGAELNAVIHAGTGRHAGWLLVGRMDGWK